MKKLLALALLSCYSMSIMPLTFPETIPYGFYQPLIRKVIATDSGFFLPFVKKQTEYVAYTNFPFFENTELIRSTVKLTSSRWEYLRGLKNYESTFTRSVTPHLVLAGIAAGVGYGAYKLYCAATNKKQEPVVAK